MTKTFTIKKGERLKSRKLIDQLFKTGRRFNNGPFRVFYELGSVSTAGQVPEPRVKHPASLLFGVGAGTRNFKKAADRNRIKRLTRENWRVLNIPLKQALDEQNRSLHVFIIYTGKELPEYALVSTQLTRVIDNLLHLVHEKNTPLP
ncbi:MAG: ribonuclease P protein component [Chitinophagaceae bacterium]